MLSAMNRVVYDSELGRVDTCARCGRRLDRCTCERAPARPAAAGQIPRDGVVRILRDRKQRGGKVVTVIAGVPSARAVTVATELKRLCGSGGTVKGDTIELQGDHRDRAADLLRERGYTVKLAGG
ncbi:MAG: stress response translation initiation inhibitor YciH [Chloroflexi bacterium]|nr:stress response translation initiation inhibitor YciH [Chloroflexota bacterium]